MSTSQTSKHLELESIQAVRDELALQVHLMKADIKTEWEALDKKWQDTKNEMRRVISSAEQSSQEISVSFKNLMISFRDGFNRLRRTLKS